MFPTMSNYILQRAKVKPELLGSVPNTRTSIKIPLTIMRMQTTNDPALEHGLTQQYVVYITPYILTV